MISTSKTVPLGSLRENDYNPRQDLGDVESLADSIEADGLISALTVRPVGDGEYEVIAGSRRLAALRSRFDDDRPVEVVVKDVDDETARRMALKENVEREDLTTMEEAWAFAREIKVDIDGTRFNFAEVHGNEVGQVGYDSIPSIGAQNSDVQEVADSIGKSGDYVAQRVSFLTLPEDVHPLIDAGDLTKRAARMLARISIDDSEERAAAIKDIISKLPESMSDDEGLREVPRP